MIAVGEVHGLQPLHVLEQIFNVDRYLRLLTKKTLLQNMINNYQGNLGCMNLVSHHFLSKIIFYFEKENNS